MNNRITKQSGIGLIELMVSITLGLFLISGAIGVFISSKSSYNLNNELTWIQDNARFAMTTLNKDMRMSGFFGCAKEQGLTSALNTPSGTGWYTDFTNLVTGYDGDDNGYPGVEFPGAYNSNPATGFPSSDLVTLRRAGDEEVRVVDNTPTNVSSIDISGTHTYQAGDILVITDCNAATIFQASGTTSSTISHDTGAGSPGNCTGLLGTNLCSSSSSNEKKFLGVDGAMLSKVISHAYYVSAANNGTPSLYRRELVNNGGNADVSDEELAQGVENLQVLYGLDSDGNGYANQYLDADDVSAANWANIVTIRLHVLFRSFAEVASQPQSFRFVDATYTPNDNFIRQEFVSTVELRNKG